MANPHLLLETVYGVGQIIASFSFLTIAALLAFNLINRDFRVSISIIQFLGILGIISIIIMVVVGLTGILNEILFS